MSFRMICCAAAVAVAAAPPALADSLPLADSATEELVVSALRLDAPAAEAGSSVTVITSADIEARGYTFALDALAAAPGVTIKQNGTFGGQASIRIRGAASQHTMVLIDGVPVNDPSTAGGGYNIATLDASDIERIEILKGPQSTLWGSDAMGGVINIVTRSTPEGLRQSLFLEGGSYGHTRGGVTIGHGGERGDASLSLSHVRTDGISSADKRDGNSERDGYEAWNISARGGLNLPAGMRLDATARYVDAESEFDGFGSATGVQDADAVGESREISGSLALQVPVLDDRLQNRVSVGYSKIDRENFDDGVRSYLAEGERLALRYQGDLTLNDRNQLLFGAERERSEANGDAIAINGYFGLYAFKPVNGVTLSAGLRTDDHDRFGSTTTARLTAAWAARDDLTLRASWGEGFKAPSLYQMTYFCCGATAPNADLKPETTRGYDLGFERDFAERRGNFGVTWFEQDTRNLISYSSAVGGYENIQETEVKGVEVTGGFDLSSAFGIAASYTWLDAVDGAGNRSVRLPKHAGEVELRYNPTARLSSALVVLHNGEERDTRGTVDKWTRVDLSGSWQVGSTIELYARIENLLDEHYQQIYGYGTPGRSGHVGARLRL